MSLIAAAFAQADRWFVAEWRDVLKRTWSIRVTAFWGAVSGLILIWPAIDTVLPVWFYALGGVVISMVWAVARVLKQPGTDT